MRHSWIAIYKLSAFVNVQHLTIARARAFPVTMTSDSNVASQSLTISRKWANCSPPFPHPQSGNANIRRFALIIRENHLRPKLDHIFRNSVLGSA